MLEASQLSARLDQDHLPETNGRMAICRRCGNRTDDAAGHHHLANERQLVRADQWLTAQEHRRHVDHVRDRRSGL
jgi:hypothetical protein